METLEFALDRKRVGLSLGLALFLLIAFTSLAIGGVMTPGSRGSTAALLCFAAVMDAIAVRILWVVLPTLRKPVSQLVLDADGLTDRSLQTGKIAWGEIVSARLIVRTRLGLVIQKAVAVKLHDEDVRVAQLPSTQRKQVALNRAMGYEAFNVSLLALAITPQQFQTYMNEARAKLGFAPVVLTGR